MSERMRACVKFQIEKDIPIPKQGKRNVGLTDTMRALEIGDSFVITTKATSRVQVYTAATRLGITVRTRATDEDKLRVWRIDSKRNTKGRKRMKRIIYKDGTSKDVSDESAWEFENDPDYERTEELEEQDAK